MDINKFGEIIDGFLKDAPVQMMITFPEGTLEPEIEDNHGMGVVINYYMMLNVLKTLMRELIELDISMEQDGSGKIDKAEVPKLISNLIELVKNDLLKEFDDDNNGK